VLLERAVLQTLRAPWPLLPLLSGRRKRIDGQLLDRQVQLLIRIAALTGQPDTSELTPTQARESLGGSAKLMGKRPPALHEVREQPIPRPGGGSLSARLYRPCPGTLPLLIYFHGGGWVAGNVDSHDALCRDLAAMIGCLVLSVDYRLAPEHPFPAAFDDALLAFRWAREHHAELDASDRIAVAGDSAGGNLSAAVSLFTKDEGGPCFQGLLYPAVDLTRETRSYELFGEGFLLTRRAMHWFMDHYLPNASDRRDTRASPLLADDVAGVAPALVVTAGFDLLRDEGEAYAKRLEEAGVAVTLRRFETLTHGLYSMTGRVRAAKRALSETVDAFRAGFA
jgi:acetyl esterase